jgi:hypothetical protein
MKIMALKVSPAITNGAFVDKGENVAVIGDQPTIDKLCASIVETCRNVGKSVHVLMSDAETANSDFDSAEVASDLLFVWQLPQKSTAGEALARVLFQRSEHGKSTLLASCERPLNWDRCHLLGRSTFWTAGSIGLGLLLHPGNPGHQPYLDRIRVPENDPNRALFYQHSVALMSWIIDPAVQENFDGLSYRPDWHWINCWRDNQES